MIYEYKVEGETRILSVTSSEASEFAGEDIKTVGTDIFLLEELVKKTELSNVVIGGAAVDSNAQVDFSNSGQTEKVLGFTVVNYAEDDICEVYLSVEAGKTSAHQSMSRADGASLLSGENVDFQLISEDFSKEKSYPVSADKLKLRLFFSSSSEYMIFVVPFEFQSESQSVPHARGNAIFSSVFR